MPEEKKWQFELEEYIRQGEPEQTEKCEIWKTSDYLLDTAKGHIEGKISISEAQRRIQNYYEERSERLEVQGESDHIIYPKESGY